MERIFSRFRALCSCEYRMALEYDYTLLSVKTKIIFLTLAETGQNTIRELERHLHRSPPCVGSPPLLPLQ